MKNLKIVLLTFLICGFTFISCQNQDNKINFQEKITNDIIFQEIKLKDIKDIKQFTLIKFHSLYQLEDSIYWFIGFRDNIPAFTISGIYNSNNNKLNIVIDNQKTDISADSTRFNYTVESTKFFTNINNNKHYIIITFNFYSNWVVVNEYLQDTLYSYYFIKPDHDRLIENIINEFKNSLAKPKIQKKSDMIKIEFINKIDSFPISENWIIKVK